MGVIDTVKYLLLCLLLSLLVCVEFVNLFYSLGVFFVIIQVLGIAVPGGEVMCLQITFNPLGLVISNVKEVQDVRKTRISELGVINSKERGFKNSF